MWRSHAKRQGPRTSRRRDSSTSTGRVNSRKDMGVEVDHAVATPAGRPSDEPSGLGPATL